MRNNGQRKAYESDGHCVILAGPGSGKTKVLSLKLARILSEEIEPPRGAACITYSNECARELEYRLADLGVEPSKRVFIGTVHSFSLSQILIPYSSLLDVDLPDNFNIATKVDQKAAFKNAYGIVIGNQGTLHKARTKMDNYRRLNLNRSSSEWHNPDFQNARLVEEYENSLRAKGLIDYDDMTLMALRALEKNKWLRKALVAKFPVLAVDEYQDLGCALHKMVMMLCFDSGMRLLAVGDTDQSIYGFNGACPELFKNLSERTDVEKVALKFNYRCGSKIIKASEIILNEERGYKHHGETASGAVYFHKIADGYKNQAHDLFRKVIPKIQKNNPKIVLGEIAILYREACLGDEVAQAAKVHGHAITRADKNAVYPKSSKLMRWLEKCAAWCCCEGWSDGCPKWSRIVAEGNRLFSESLTTDEDKHKFAYSLIEFMWHRQDSQQATLDWLLELRNEILWQHLSSERSLINDKNILDKFITWLSEEVGIRNMSLGQFSGVGKESDRINLSTFHSAKGREFKASVLFGVDSGIIPKKTTPTLNEVIADRRLFYVAVTRAQVEVHIVYSESKPSLFVTELKQRLNHSS